MSKQSLYIDREKLKYREGVNIFVMNDNQEFLAVQKNKYSINQWDIPGGGTDGEPYETAVYRELSEEVGFEKGDIELLGAYDGLYIFEWPQEDIIEGGMVFRGQAKKLFLVKLIHPKPVALQKEELRDYMWIKETQFPDFFIFENQLSTYKEALDYFRNKKWL